MDPTDSSATRSIYRTYLQTSGTTYRNGISSRSSWYWLVGCLWSTAFTLRSEYSLNIPNGLAMRSWCATAFSRVSGEARPAYILPESGLAEAHELSHAYCIKKTLTGASSIEIIAENQLIIGLTTNRKPDCNRNKAKIAHHA